MPKRSDSGACPTVKKKAILWFCLWHSVHRDPDGVSHKKNSRFVWPQAIETASAGVCVSIAAQKNNEKIAIYFIDGMTLMTLLTSLSLNRNPMPKK